MAELTVDGLGELTSPAANDEIGIWDVSAGQYLKIRRDTLVGGVITGGGTVATGGFTLTVPATGTAVLLSGAQIITGLKTFSGLINDGDMVLSSGDLSAGAGRLLAVGKNNNASTPAPGTLNLVSAAASPDNNFIWVDDSAQLRILNGYSSDQPSNANRNSAGVVVGAQTSHARAKSILGPPVDDSEALTFICAAAQKVSRFFYRSGAYNQEFSGLVLDGPALDRYGQDADAEHPAGKSLNAINAFGDLFLAVRNLADRINVLESAT